MVVQPREESTVTSETLHEIGLRDCRDSLFERLFRLIRQNAYDGLDDMLKCQGRMHETISRFVNERYYEGQLSTVPLPHQTEPWQWPRYDKDNTLQAYLATHRMGVFDVPSQQETDNDRINEEEASVIAQIIEQLHNLSLANNLLWNPQKLIGIIVPFRGQITAIRHQLESLNIPKHQEITIDTVERFQGSQRDIIVFSTVIHKPWQLRILSCPVDCNGVLIDRKLNVAISRARKQFLLVGNLQLLRQADDYRKFIDYCL